MRTAIVFALLLIPSEARLSGSSTVEAVSEFFAVQIQSIRPIFRDPDQEREWHKSWKDENRENAEKLKRALEPKFPALQKRFKIMAYNKDYPEVHDALADEESQREITKKPFRCKFDVGFISIIVAFSSKPPAAVRRDLQRELEKLLPR